MDDSVIDPALQEQSAAAAKTLSDNMNKCKADLIDKNSSKKSK